MPRHPRLSACAAAHVYLHTCARGRAGHTRDRQHAATAAGTCEAAIARERAEETPRHEVLLIALDLTALAMSWIIAARVADSTGVDHPAVFEFTSDSYKSMTLSIFEQADIFSLKRWAILN